VAPLVDTSARIYLAGHTGLVGGAIHRALDEAGFSDVVARGTADVDLTDQAATHASIKAEQPDAVIIAAAKVGGIMANWEQPWEFIYLNLLIEANLIGAAFACGVRRLIFLGSSCIYPREAPQPLREEYLLTGPLEETNRPYAVAKIAGIELCRSLNREYGTDYLSLMPTNLYGPGDNFDLRTSHVLPALIRRFHEAKVGLPDEAGQPRAPQGPVTLWGTGAPLREFLYVDDVGRAVIHCLQHVSAADVPDGLLNVGCGEDLAIRDLALLVQRVVGHSGEIVWDSSKPDGTPRKLMDVSRIEKLGWSPSVSLEDGVRLAYDWYLANRTATDGSFVDPRRVDRSIAPKDD
jgi:GDP-L-fucose synthase